MLNYYWARLTDARYPIMPFILGLLIFGLMGISLLLSFAVGRFAVVLSLWFLFLGLALFLRGSWILLGYLRFRLRRKS